MLDYRRLGIIILVLVLALTVRDFLLSSLVILFGSIIVLWLRYQATEAERSHVNEDAELATLQMRSLLSVDHSLLGVLKQLKLPEGSLRTAVQQVASRLQMHEPPEHAALPLRELPGSVTARLATLIANSSRITDQVQLDLFQSLETEAHRQKIIRSKMKQTLALVRGTIRLLQAVTTASIFFVLMVPDWRVFFLQDIPHRTLLTGLILCAVVASLYFEVEVHQLGSGEAL
jgi:hypothetical protein